MMQLATQLVGETCYIQTMEESSVQSSSPVNYGAPYVHSLGYKLLNLAIIICVTLSKHIMSM